MGPGNAVAPQPTGGRERLATWTAVAAVAALVLSAGCQQPVTSTFVRIDTADGWRLSLRRFEPEVVDPSRAPVVLCHGLNCNDHFWDLHEKVSLARYLAGRGYDVWVPALRGAGRSTKHGFVVMRRLIRPVLPELPHELSLRIIDPNTLNWTMDDYVEYDVPAILATVREQTGAPAVHWVGHSMGGVIIYAYVERFGDEGLATITTLGTPLTIPQPPNEFLRAFGSNKELFSLITFLINASVPASWQMFGQRDGVRAAMYNPRNVDRSVLHEFYTKGVEDIPTGVLEQLVDSVKTGSLRSKDGEVNYAAELGKVTVPCFVAGGLVDLIAEPESIRYVYNNIGSEDKAFHIFAVVNNNIINYGHLDLVIGRYAPRDVFPAIERWLAKHRLPAPYQPRKSGRPQGGPTPE